MSDLIPPTVKTQLLKTFEQNARDTRGVYQVLLDRKQVNQLGEVCENYAEAMLAEMESVGRARGLEYEMKEVSIATKATADVVFWKAWRTLFGSGPTPDTAWLPTVSVPFPPAPVQRAPDKIGFVPPPPLGLTMADVVRLVDTAVASAIASTPKAMTVAEIQQLVTAAIEASHSKPEETETELETTNAQGQTSTSKVRSRRRALA